MNRGQWNKESPEYAYPDGKRNLAQNIVTEPGGRHIP